MKKKLTFKGFETFLKKHHALRRFTKNFDDYCLRPMAIKSWIKDIDSFNPIMAAFIWEATPEGEDYWGNIYIKYRREFK